LVDESLYARSLALHCRPAAAALGTLGTDSARRILAEQPSYIQMYGLLHDESTEGLDALLTAALDPVNGHELARLFSAEHVFADLLLPLLPANLKPFEATTAPNGRWSFDGQVVRATNDGRVVAELPDMMVVGEWRPDGKLLVATSYFDRALWFIWPDEGEVREVRTLVSPLPPFTFDADRVTLHSGQAFDGRTGISSDGLGPWSPQASTDAWTLSTSPTGVARFRLKGAEPVHLEPQLVPFNDRTLEHGTRPHTGAASEGGRRAAVMYDNGAFAVYDLDVVHPPIETGWPPFAPIAWQDNANFEEKCDDFIRINPLGKTAPAMDSTGRKEPVGQVLLSPNGQVLATVGERPSGGGVLQIWDAATGEIWQRTRFDYRVRLEGFEQDGHLQVSSGIQVFRVMPGPKPRPLTEVATTDRRRMLPTGQPKRSCKEVEVMVLGEPRLMRFDSDGEPCP